MLNAGERREFVATEAAEAEMTPKDWLAVNEPDWSDAGPGVARIWSDLVSYYETGNLE